MNRTSLTAWIFILLTCISSSSSAENLLMVRTHMPFEYAMDEVQTLLEEYEYKIAHTQRCDGGLTDFGYQSDYYRVIFFGKIEEVRSLTEKYPQMVPFLPLKMLVFAEKNETVIVALNPQSLSDYINDQPVKIQLQRWRNDILSIFNEMRDKKHVLPQVNQETDKS